MGIETIDTVAAGEVGTERTGAIQGGTERTGAIQEGTGRTGAIQGGTGRTEGALEDIEKNEEVATRIEVTIVRSEATEDVRRGRREDTGGRIPTGRRRTIEATTIRVEEVRDMIKDEVEDIRIIEDSRIDLAARMKTDATIENPLRRFLPFRLKKLRRRRGGGLGR